MSEEERAKKNEVFAGTRLRESDVPAVSMADTFKNDFGFEIPHEVVPLPSNGKVYPSSSPLCDRNDIEIRAMTAKEEDILTSSALLKKGTVITELIKSCLIDKRVDPRDMIAGDRNALMVAIRVTGYGALYDAEVTCGDCDQKSPREFNLTELAIKRLDVDPIQNGVNEFQFMLPRVGKMVSFKLLTGRDEEEISSTQEKQKKLQMNSDNSVTLSLIHSITSLDGITDKNKIAQFVRMMPAGDSLALRTYIRSIEPGITMKQETQCKFCGHSEEVSIPFGISFLWPNTSR